MITRRTATKEMAEVLLVLLHRNCHKIPADDYDKLHNFIKACVGRLPRMATVERDMNRRLVKAGGRR